MDVTALALTPDGQLFIGTPDGMMRRAE